MNKATDNAVRERVYKAHLEPLLAIGYNYGYKWYKLQSEARANETLGDGLVSGTGLHDCAELLDLFAAINRGTMDSLLSETARIRACVGGSSSPEGQLEQFQSWQTEWYTSRYEAQINGKLGVSAASIRCCEWPQVLDGLMNLAGGLFGCRFARDDTTPDGQAANAAFEIWHVYDALEGDEQGAELGRIFIDFATKRRSGGSQSNTSRFMPVLTPAPLGSSKAPQVLWTVSQPVTRFSVTGVRVLASDLGRIMETLFALAIDPTYTPPALQDDSQPSLSAYIMRNLSFDGKTLDDMLNPAARAQDMGRKMRRSAVISLTQWIRAYFAETHALVAAAHAFDVDRSLSENVFIKSHAEAAASWGTHVPLSCRLPQTIMRGGQSWPGLVRRSCLNVTNQVLAAQFVARVLPGGLEAGFDQDLVGHYRQFLRHQFGTNREGSRRALLNVIGGSLDAEALCRRFASDVKVFDEEEDERARVLRPIVLRLIKRRAERKQGTSVAE
ncbi:hypothetical protein FFLO_04529 [Filobasidium floriforme]|uniref:Uncharacterized protein n=1 Tax=Filobasidium floriforme TaxID=5210 RepID=A0A8K0JIQ0_9TREE|nr:uncharacterized protein HD553DRAFT_320898 [Filobasidium floriforme]KAG7531225.1 hypothetical protein FFLO_04529 [Filobasidium floriforme]KAH8077358.1 hypothetical protein HD553DRAFT_320898 [Filobasidium floriforme]